MTSGSILPTFGLVPPDLRRTPIPRELQPDLPDPAERLRNPPEPVEIEEETSASSEDESTGRPIAVSGSVALSAQENSNEQSNQPPIELPSASQASRRIQQALEASSARESDDDENAQGLTEEEEAQVRDLQERDREVRAHEQAHANVGGIYAGAPTYQFVTGPDGRRYAVSGQVQIDTAEIEGDPEATIEKLETVRRAALAPAEPSAQDRRVAQQAAAGITEARAELQQERAEEQAELTGADDDTESLDQSVTEQLAESRDVNGTDEEDNSEEETGFANTLQGQAAFGQTGLSQETFSQTTFSQVPFSDVAGNQTGQFARRPSGLEGIDLLA